MKYTIESYNYECSSHMGNFYRENGEELTYITKTGFRILNKDGEEVKGKFLDRESAENYAKETL